MSRFESDSISSYLFEKYRWMMGSGLRGRMRANMRRCGSQVKRTSRG